MKAADERLREIVATIRDGARVNPSKRQWVAKRVADWIDANPALAQQTSNQVSLTGDAVRPGTQGARSSERALRFLKSLRIYGNPLVFGNVTTLDKAVADAWTVLSGDSPSFLGSLRTQLLGNPGDFLKKHYVNVGGLDASQVTTYHLRFDDHQRLRLYPSQLEIPPNPQAANAGDLGGINYTYQGVQAVNIPATLIHGVEDDIGNIPSTDSADYHCNVMLTTQFTGCTYCFQVNGNRMLGAHIDPGGGGRTVNPAKADVMAAKLRVQGRFDTDIGGTGFRAFGRLPAGAAQNAFGYGNQVGTMVIVAVLNDDGWTIVAQIRDTTLNISGVRRLYPNPPVYL